MFLISQSPRRAYAPASALLLVALLVAGCGAPAGRTPTGTTASTPSPAPAATAAVAATEAPTVTQPASVASASTDTATTGAQAGPTTAGATAAATQEPATTGEPPATASASPAATEATAPATVVPTAAATPGRVMAPPTSAALKGLKLSVQVVASGLEAPLFATHAPDDDRIFILEKAGRIRILTGGNVLDQPFLDVTDRVGSKGTEQGLLGLAFPPDYAKSRFFYINYTDRNGDTVIGRFKVTADPNVGDPGSESPVLKVDQPAANHNGGDLVFGPDGYLWIGMGDGGGANDTYRNGQNPQSFLAKVLRIDVTSDTSKPYTIPADNPWVKADWNGKDVIDEAWSIGMRNPWRFSFDTATGDLWIADVGQNRYEEVDYVPEGSKGGLNFGWPIMEGLHCTGGGGCNQEGLVLPVAEYQHGEDGCSITGGYVYRGTQFPELAGAYLYGDYCSGRVWGLGRDGDTYTPVLMLDTNLLISSFGQDRAGELYLTDLVGGKVYRLVIE